MVACALDMVMAGTETTSSTLQWAALLMAKHPRVQGELGEPSSPGPRAELAEAPRTLASTLSPTDRVQEELDCVLGPGRPPRLEDQQALPYTNAVLHEVQRYITLLPHMPRRTTADTRLGSYLLPKVGGLGPHSPWPPPGPSSTCSSACGGWGQVSPWEVGKGCSGGQPLASQPP